MEDRNKPTVAETQSVAQIVISTDAVVTAVHDVADNATPVRPTLNPQPKAPHPKL